MLQTETPQRASAQTAGGGTPSRAQARWSEAALLAARHRADPVVDQLVQEVLGAGGGDATVGRRAYNHLLDITDKLLEAPELALVTSSTVARQLRRYPSPLVDYFDPMEAPDWVDTAKLHRASRLWDENMLAIIGVLYAASLPSCYLIRHGIPALYQSSKLKEHRYIYQRIYETGRFLDDVMSPGGLAVITDLETDDSHADHLCTALNTLDPDGGWTRVGPSLVCTLASAPPLDPQHVMALARQLRPVPKRYLWGRGYIAAKKVRFLHAAMRFMLTHPYGAVSGNTGEADPTTIAESLGQPVRAWDEDTWGKPVNQEDLAYTLLTFAYLIPQGLEKWGCRWTLADKEAFLHLWKTVGYMLGVDSDLLTDTWDEAEQLFSRLRHQQAGPSDEGKRLTDTLIRFLQDYLPPALARHVPPLLIQSQIGARYAAMIFTPAHLKATQDPLARVYFGIFLGLIRLYYLVRNAVFRRSATIAAFMGSVFAQVGEALIDSWRDVYARRPFYVPADAATWQPMQGVREDFMVHLRAWRTRLFATVAAGLGFLLGSSCSLAVAIALWLLGYSSGAQTAGWLTLGGWLTALGIFKICVPRVSRQRPKLPE